MSWRIATEHRSAYRYAEPVTTSFNEARISPAASRGQTVIESTVVVEPATPLFTYVDYWSTLVVAFDVAEPHSELVVTGSSIVETPSAGAIHAELDWDELERADIQDQFAEFLLPTAYTEGDDELAAITAELVEGQDLASAVEVIGGWTRDRLDYVAGATEVSTSALEAWRRGAGVCQDFAHLTLAVARAMGLPGRYCSGYLHPNADAGIGHAVVGESHAWVELWAGDWQGFDPTIGWPVGERHVLVARGRDYGDVTPLKGVFHGGPTAALEVGVELTRLA